jgi:multicomponent Na+:H+ antiporter subunit E
MNFMLLNILLAIIWRIAVGRPGIEHLVVGFIVGYLILWWLRPLIGPSAYFRKLPLAISFIAFFIWELVKSNLRVAWDVVTPSAYRQPAIIAVPLDAKTDEEITLLAVLITLTPGSLSIDVSQDKRVLYVHGMFVDDADAYRREIKEGFERRVMELLR